MESIRKNKGERGVEKKKDPTAGTIDPKILKSERVVRFLRTVAQTAKSDLQFIIQDKSPKTKAIAIAGFLRLIGVEADDVPGLVNTYRTPKEQK